MSRSKSTAKKKSNAKKRKPSKYYRESKRAILEVERLLKLKRILSRATKNTDAISLCGFHFMEGSCAVDLNNDSFINLPYNFNGLMLSDVDEDNVLI
jgi:hypothetical protein